MGKLGPYSPSFLSEAQGGMMPQAFNSSSLAVLISIMRLSFSFQYRKNLPWRLSTLTVTGFATRLVCCANTPATLAAPR
jgi:hypothetical protein